MPIFRKAIAEYTAKPILEGAGVHLSRVFGKAELSNFDPFLLLDDFRGDNPDGYLPGFPMHPHRGIETITYMLEGTVDHRDSIGNAGTIGPGDVQWMSAGSGILHEEMPHGDTANRMYGFQLWANLPAASKMMPPRYQEVLAADIPLLDRQDGSKVRIIAGQVDGVEGPVRDIIIEPEYLDVEMPNDSLFIHDVIPGHTVFVYVIAGAGRFGGTDTSDIEARKAANRTLISFGRDEGDQIAVRAGREGVRFLLISGKPLDEPVAWGGPIVMNTREELQLAFRELEAGTFIK